MAFRLARLRLGLKIKPVPDFYLPESEIKYLPESEMKSQFLRLETGNGYLTGVRSARSG